jgi:exosortase/archaeosortase family protein
MDILSLVPVEDLSVLAGTGLVGTLKWWDLAFFIPALVLMGFGYADRGKYTKLIRGAGMLLFGLFWFSQVSVYLEPDHTDLINGIMSMVGGFFFLFMGFHFFLDHIWKERTKSIEWLLRTSFLTGGAYFVFEHIPFTQGALIYIVAWPTYWILRIFGHDVIIQDRFPSEIGGGMAITSADPGADMAIRIVFACTAALALFLFTSAVVAVDTNRKEWEGWAKKELKRTKNSKSIWTKGKRNGIKNILKMTDSQRKLYAVAMVVPLIFVSNLFRNVAVIAATFTGTLSFYDAHNIYAKILSLVMMIYLTWVLFELLPELQEDVMGLFDLTKRVKKGMMKDGRVDLKYIQRTGNEKERGV